MRMIYTEKQPRAAGRMEKLIDGLVKLSTKSESGSGLLADSIHAAASAIVAAARKITEKMDANERAITALSSAIKDLPPHPHAEKLHLRVTEWTKTGRIETIEVTRIR